MDFVKLYKGFWTGSMRETEPFTRLVFIAMLSIADSTGLVCGSPDFIAAFAAIDIEHVNESLRILMSPDPHSTSKDLDGARVVQEGNNRYRIVNFSKYYDMNRTEERREYWKEYRRNERKSKDSGSNGDDVHTCSQLFNEVHRFTSKKEKEKDKEKENITPISPKGEIVEIVSYLNSKAGKAYKPTSNWKDLSGRLSEGATVEECKLVIDFKCNEWKGTEMERYLTPLTLFRKSHWSTYLPDAQAWSDPNTIAYQKDEQGRVFYIDDEGVRVNMPKGFNG